MNAKCTMHGTRPAPQRYCYCGIYAMHDSQKATPRLAYAEAIFITILEGALVIPLTASCIAGDLVLLRLISTWQLIFLPAFFILMAFAIVGILLSGLWIVQLATFFLTSKISGAVALTGHILIYPDGMRAERARILCLVRPLGFSRRLAKRLSAELSVPIFEWWQKEKVMTYVLEHARAYRSES